MEIVENTKEKLILRIDANESLVNSIRRSISEIKTLAIDEVEIFKNDSALYDEIIAHRIGLIPLKTEKAMNNKTKIDLKLSKIGPCTVYSGDLKGPVELIHDNIPLTILNEGHKLELVATATLGKSMDHEKYSPGLCYYRHILEVKSSTQVDKIIEKSKGIIKSTKKGSKWYCDLKDSEVTEIENLDKEAIADSDELLFIIESYGNLPAKEIMSLAIESIEENLDEFLKELK